MIAPVPTPPRLVLDTNVLLSGVFFRGVPGRILDAWEAGLVSLVFSPSIWEEYQEAGAELATRYPDAAMPLSPLLTRLAQAATIVDAPDRLPSPVSTDPDDDKFLACAVASRAFVIVSGDKDLLRVDGWNGIGVLTPRQVVDRYRLP